MCRMPATESDPWAERDAASRRRRGIHVTPDSSPETANRNKAAADPAADQFNDPTEAEHEAVADPRHVALHCPRLAEHAACASLADLRKRPLDFLDRSPAARRPQKIPLAALGKVTTKQAQAICLRVEHLLQAQRLGTPHDAATAEWVKSLGAAMCKKLVKADLLTGAPAVLTLRQLIEKFLAARTVRPGTMATYNQATDSLICFFGAARHIDTITPADADAWQAHIAKAGRVREKKGPRTLARATVAKRTNIAKAIFSKAVKWKILTSTPFEDVKSGSQANPHRSEYISAEDTERLLAACPDVQLQALIALARYAGLRCPSEMRELKWSDVNWDKRSLTVRSPKTEAHANAVRIAPVSPALLPILLELRAAAEPGQELLLPLAQESHGSLYQRARRIRASASLKEWPRLFQNLQASRETDWVANHPAHEVARWMGNSVTVAAKHYLQARDAHFQTAVGAEAWTTPVSRDVAKSVAPAVQNRLQREAAANSRPSPTESLTPEMQRGCAGSGEPAQPRACASDGRRGIRTPCGLPRVSRGRERSGRFPLNDRAGLWRLLALAPPVRPVSMASESMTHDHRPTLPSMATSTPPSTPAPRPRRLRLSAPPLAVAGTIAKEMATISKSPSLPLKAVTECGQELDEPIASQPPAQAAMNARPRCA